MEKKIDTASAGVVTRRAMLAGAAAAAALTLPQAAQARKAVMGSDKGNILDQHDALGLAKLIRDKAVTPGELLEAAIARAEEGNARFNFMAQKLYDHGRQAIAAGLPEGPFRGVPLLVKDLNTHIAGQRSGQGSRFYADYRPDFTSELVRRQQAAGFVIFGKTTTPEFGPDGACVGRRRIDPHPCRLLRSLRSQT